MEVEFRCLKCKEPGSAELEAPDFPVACSHCAQNYGGLRDFLDSDRRIQRCIICECKDLYMQRDFNRKLGCAIVVVGAILAPFTKLISLFVCAFIDLLLYWLLPAITVCYRCHAIYRGFPSNPQHEGFNLGINDHYRAADR